MTRHDRALAELLYSPSAATLSANLPAIGEALVAACCDLTHNLTVSHCDQMIQRLRAAQHAISRLRQRLVEEAGT